MPLPREFLHYNSPREKLQKAKPLLQNLVLESLQAYENASPKKRYCGICLSGALSETRTPFLNLELDSSNAHSVVRATTIPKYTRPPGMSIQKTDDDDARVWTAMLRFLMKPRTQEEMKNLLHQLGNTSACPCSKAEDVGVIFPKQKVVISLHYLNEIGRGVARTYFIMGHFSPSTWKTSTSDDRQPQRDAPPALASLRGRGSSGSPNCDSQTSKYLPPVTALDNLPDTPLGVILILTMMDMLAYTTSTRASTPLQKGRRLWPYSPRELLLLVKDEVPASSDMDYSDVLEECASTILRALEQWSTLVPKTMTIMLATSLIEMCGMLFVPQLTRSSFSTTVVISLARHVIHNSMDALQKAYDSEIAYSHLASRKDIAQWIINAFASVSSYFNVMTFRHDIPHEERQILFRPVRLKLLQLFTMMTYLLDDSRIPKSMKSSKRWKDIQELTHTLCYHYLQRVLKEYPGAGNGSQMVAVHPELLMEARAHCHGDIFEDVDCGILRNSGVDESKIFFLKGLQSLWKRRYCFAPGCPKSIRVVGADFKACSGCGIARYCSRVCQKADWKGSEDHPKHSRVCGILGHFRQSLLISEGKPDPADIDLEDESWILLCGWYKSLVQPEVGGDNRLGLPSWKGFVKGLMQFANIFLPIGLQLISKEDTAALTSASWEDFIDILTQLMVLAHAPTPTMMTL